MVNDSICYWIRFYQSITRAFNVTNITQSPDQSASQGRFPTPQFTLEINHTAWITTLSQHSSQALHVSWASNVFCHFHVILNKDLLNYVNKAINPLLVNRAHHLLVLRDQPPWNAQTHLLWQPLID